MKKPKIFENRAKMPTAYIFVDYESWFYSMKNNYNVTPALDGWIAKMRKQYYIPEIYFFADYSDPEVYREIDKLRKYSNFIIDTSCNPKMKNDTDFIMLDCIYRKAAASAGNETFILMTGDGHFTYAVMYLVQSGHPVGICGVKNSTSRMLTDQATWYEILDGEGVMDVYRRRILEYFSVKDNGYFQLQHTFQKTSEMIAKRYDLDVNVVKNAMRKMKDDGYLESRKEKSASHGNDVEVFSVNWQAVKKDNLMPENAKAQ